MIDRKTSVELLDNAREEIILNEKKLSMAIHNKNYITVANKIGILRKHFGTRATVTTKIIENTDSIFDDNGKMKKSGKVIVKTNIFIDRELVSTGTAEEFRAASHINKTSALENCETSSVGRALSFLGLTNSDIASAEEMQQAKKQQAVKEGNGLSPTPITVDGLYERFKNASHVEGLKAIVSEPDVHEYLEGLKGTKEFLEFSKMYQQQQKKLTKGKIKDGKQ